MRGHPRRDSGIEVLGIVRRRRWVGLVTFAVLSAAVGSLVWYLPDLYRATSTVLVERHHVPESFVPSSVTGELDTRLQTISQEVLSRARLERLITRFGLYAELRQKASVEAAVEAMRRDIRVELKGVESPNGRTATVAFVLSYRGRDPEMVAAVTNALAAFYVDENVRLRAQQASTTAAFLRSQLVETKARLDEHERRVREFRSRSLGELPQQLPVNLATLERLHAQLHLVSANQLRAVDRHAALEKQLAEIEPGRAGGTDGAIARLAKLKQELAELRSKFTDRYPDVARLREEVAALERDLARGSASEPAAPADPAVTRMRLALRDVDAEIDSLKADEQRLRRDIEAYQRRVELAPQREQELRELSRDYETTKDLYASLLKRYEDAQLAETLEQQQRGEQFRILDPALPPKEPAAPNRMRLLLGGLALAAGVAAAAMMVAERLDTSFHTIDDLRSLTTAPVLVSIPLIVTTADRWHRTRGFVVGAIATLAAVALTAKALQYLTQGSEWLVQLMARGATS